MKDSQMEKETFKEENKIFKGCGKMGKKYLALWRMTKFNIGGTFKETSLKAVANFRLWGNKFFIKENLKRVNSMTV